MKDMYNAIAAIAIGSMTGSAMLAADTITSGAVNLRDAAAIVVFVSTLVWWMGRKFAKIEDKLDNHTEHFNNLPCKPKKGKDCEEYERRD